MSRRRVVLSDTEVQLLDPEPVDDLGAFHRIPEALGGGYLFIGQRTVRFAPSFTGTLTVIGRSASGEGELTVGVGYRRVLISAPPAEPAVYALPSGAAAVPSPPGLAELFGTPRGLVAARTASGELFVSKGKGAPFAKLSAPPVTGLRYDGKGIVVDTSTDQLRLGFDGSLAPRPMEPGMTVASNVDAFVDPFPDLSKPPPEPSEVERLVDPLTGRISATRAFVVRDDDLLLLDGMTGELVRTVAGAFEGRSNCFPVRGGQPSFVGCNADAVALYRLDSPRAAPVLEREIPGTYSQDFGEPGPTSPLVFGKRCDGTERVGALCIRRDADRWEEQPPPADPQGLLARVPFIVHVAASQEGQGYAFGWLDGGGDLVIVDGRVGRVRRVPNSAMPPWADGGVDWSTLSIEDGTLRFLLSNAGPSRSAAGIVEIRPDDTVRAVPLAGRLAAIGGRGLLLTPLGELRETLDGGRTFQPVAPPPGGVLADDGDFIRCVETGCEIGPWYRIGWGRLKAADVRDR
ncbi:MAG: hypothetical protein JRI23_34365 [Deltaproteobacteria bacterium]|nr:hypothetical protein [Deltaproteobacteria bacterium]MBW2537383.1 hypothetical protein [Deltaproteobacteria bacterium]